MPFEFHIQDPTSPDTRYLFEAIVEASQGAEECAGLFAFASRVGVESLIEDGAIREFLRDSRMSLLVGIDAITTRPTLERLQELEHQHEYLSVRVFRNPSNALFHPKVVRFNYPDGGESLIVGSGNLTLGGLRRNFEAFSVMRAEAGDTIDTSSWDRFVTEHASDIRAIDEDILKAAARNVVTGRRSWHDVEQEPGTLDGTEATTTESDTPIGGSDRFLVAHVPSAGDRWRQVHFNIEVIRGFFCIQPNSSQRVFLLECQPGGTFVQSDPPRPCVYSETNRNHKIELAARSGTPYPTGGRPIAVFREIQTRSFTYMLLMPGEPGYDAMSQLTTSLENVGRAMSGVHRVIATRDDIFKVWAKCPLVVERVTPAPEDG